MGIEGDINSAGVLVFIKHFLPRLATVESLVNPIAMRNVAPDASLPCADINDVRLRRRHRQTANAPNCFFIKQRGPGHGAVGRLPDSSASRAKVVGIWIPGNSGRGQRSPAAVGTDRAVFQSLEDRIFLL